MLGMMLNDPKIISGKIISSSVKDGLRTEVAALSKRGITPGLTVVIVGENPASQIYVKSKEKTATELGMNSNVIRYESGITESDLLNTVLTLNQDDNVHGILVQLPLPAHISEKKVIHAIAPEKDVDGFHPINIGKLLIGDDTALASCTPSGVMEMLNASNVDLEGKNVVIVGRSNIVGKPLIPMFLKKNATVIVCHSRTKDLQSFTKKADVIVVAIGKARFLTKDYIGSNNPVIIDVGINRVDGKVVGDVDFEGVYDQVSRISPVPGGVGPMTIGMLLKNTIQATKNQT
jgi:methylenetetrahydrofolate dehydrogenase (NADP+) / methenyltetrahydrofolate cyclohydrolase